MERNGGREGRGHLVRSNNSISNSLALSVSTNCRLPIRDKALLPRPGPVRRRVRVRWQWHQNRYAARREMVKKMADISVLRAACNNNG